MTDLNYIEPTRIEVVDGYKFKINIDATDFKAYTGEGIVENIKVPNKISFHSLRKSLHNPIASALDG